MHAFSILKRLLTVGVAIGGFLLAGVSGSAQAAPTQVPAPAPRNSPLAIYSGVSLKLDGDGAEVCTSDTHAKGWVKYMSGEFGAAFFSFHMPGYADGTSDGPLLQDRTTLYPGVEIGWLYLEGAGYWAPAVWRDPTNCKQPQASQPQAAPATRTLDIASGSLQEYWTPNPKDPIVINGEYVRLGPGSHEIIEQRGKWAYVKVPGGGKAWVYAYWL